MKLTPDDPRLSAYLLGELPPAEAAAVERAAAADPALRLSLGDLKRVAGLLEGTLSTAPPLLRPAQREAVLNASRHADAAGKVVEFASAKHRARPWLAAIGAAAAVVLALTVASKFAAPGQRPGGKDVEATRISLMPLPGPHVGAANGAVAGGGAGSRADDIVRSPLQENPAAFLEEVSRQLVRDPLPDPARLPALKPLPPLKSSGEIALPVVIGHASYGWVRDWIRDRAALPPRSAVRIEELVNTFPLPLEAADTVVARIETAACPWNPGSVLVAATLIGPADTETVAAWSFEGHAGTRVRMLASTASDTAKLPDRLPGGRACTVLLEVAPAAGSERLGVIELQADGELSTITVDRPRGEIPPAMRQLGLVAAFGMWLRGEDELDTATLENVLHDAGSDVDPGRADTRRLVRQALDIAVAGR